MRPRIDAMRGRIYITGMTGSTQRPATRGTTMTATDTTAPVGRTEADTWAAGWAMLLGDAFAAADRAGHGHARPASGQGLSLTAASMRLFSSTRSSAESRT